PTLCSTGWRRMNADSAFFDTNVVLYLFSADATKADRAEELIASGGTISVQVLIELAAVARRKLSMTLARSLRRQRGDSSALPSDAPQRGNARTRVANRRAIRPVSV